MGRTSAKRIVLIGFIVILLIAIPLTLYILKQQSNTQSHAQASTTLSFTPVSSTTNPISTQTGSTIPLQIQVDPGKNLVSFVKIIIQYDPTKLQTAGSTAFVPNSSVFPTVLEGPVYTSGKVSVTLSIGADPTKAIQSPVSAGTITFTALGPTDSNQPTVVSYVTTTSTDTQVLSTAATDQASENVLSTTNPAYITISGTASTTVTPTTTPGTIIASTTPAFSLTPTQASTNSADVPTPTTAIIVPTETPVIPTATIAATGSTNVTFGAAAVLTTLTVIGAILFFVI